MKRWGLKQQRHSHGSFSTEPRSNAGQPAMRWPIWLFGGGFALVEPAWAARSTSFRGQWSLGSLIGSLVILGILATLVLFFIWPRQGGP
jgi:hypothetical protein